MNTSIDRILLALGCLTVGCAFSAEPAPATGAGDAMDSARGLLQKWADTQRLIASERHEWEQGKALLEGRITLVQQSIEDMKKKVVEAEAKLADAKKRTAEVELEKTEAKAASDFLLTSATELETGMRTLINRVPPNVKEKVKQLADRIPKEGADVKAISAAERYQNVLGILNEMNKANLEIASLPEIHDIGNGKQAEVKAIYVGLGQAYYVNEAGSLAGVGVPGDGAWVWRTEPSIAKSMIEVIEVMKKTVSAKLVELPATID